MSMALRQTADFRPADSYNVLVIEDFTSDRKEEPTLRSPYARDCGRNLFASPLSSDDPTTKVRGQTGCQVHVTFMEVQSCGQRPDSKQLLLRTDAKVILNEA